MKPYNLKNLQEGLQEQAAFIKGKAILDIAHIEKIDPATVRTYLKGKVTTPAIGQAILKRCREILIAKNVAA